MFEIKKPKIGLAGVMCTPFRGDKEGNFAQHRTQLEALAGLLNFEFYPVLNGIYDQPQAEKASAELAEWGADFVLLQASSFASGDFLYPFVSHPWRLGIWAVPEGEPGPKGGLPLNSFTAANMYNSILKRYLREYSSPVKWFLGSPGDAIFQERLAVTVQALRGLINLPGKKIGLIGGVAPSFDNLRIDDRTLKAKLDIDVVHIELDELIQAAKMLDEAAVTQAVDAIKSGATTLAPGSDAPLEKSGRVLSALERMAEERGFQAAAISCWPRFQSEYDLAVCSVMGQLNTEGLIAACEGDITSAVSMLLLRCFTDGDIVTLMDLVSIDPEDESVLLWHCGPTAPALADERGVKMQSLWLFDGPGDETTGLHNDMVLNPGAASVIGFTTDFDEMLIIEGDVDNRKPSYVGSRGWFRDLHLNTEKISSIELVQTLMHSGFQHHYPFAYGQLGMVAMEYCAWKNIQPIKIQTYTHYLI